MKELVCFVSVLLGLVAVYLHSRTGGPLPTEKLNSSYDYIIVGAGSAGSTLAARLSERLNITVLVLEAGDSPENQANIDTPLRSTELQNSEQDWAYRTVPQKQSQFALEDNRSAWPRGKVLGGTSCLNFNAAVRGNRHDYDSWEKDGCTGWGYKDVLPYFIKSENTQIEKYRTSKYRGKDGPLVITSPSSAPLGDIFIGAGKELGYKDVDCNGEDQIGFGHMQNTVNNGKRWSTYQAFLRPAMDRSNLHVSIHSHVTKVNIVNKVATSVDYIKNNRKYTVRVNKEIIVSAGSINSPQLLMLSGLGPKEHLKALGIDVIEDLPVGKNLQDKLLVPMTVYTNTSVSLTQSEVSSWVAWFKYVFFRTGPLATTSVEAYGFLYADDDTSDNGRPPDIEFELQATNPFINGGNALSPEMTNMKKEHYNLITLDDIKDGFTLLPMMLHPKSSGYIQLRSKDPFDYPIIEPNYLSDNRDVQTLKKAIRQTKRVLSTNAFQRLGVDPSAKSPLSKLCSQHGFDSEKYWECYIRTYAATVYHPTSTCRMGDTSDTTAVVDPQLRVKGIQGLRVVDASVMRNNPSGNPNLPIIMIAEKAAYMILNS